VRVILQTSSMLFVHFYCSIESRDNRTNIHMKWEHRLFSIHRSVFHSKSKHPRLKRSSIACETSTLTELVNGCLCVMSNDTIELWTFRREICSFKCWQCCVLWRMRNSFTHDYFTRTSSSRLVQAIPIMNGITCYNRVKLSLYTSVSSDI
jgi:hypothetical protein